MLALELKLNIAILKHKRNRKFDFFSVKKIFISFMNTTKPQVKVPVLVCTREIKNKNQSYSEKVNYHIYPPIRWGFCPSIMTSNN